MPHFSVTLLIASALFVVTGGLGLGYQLVWIKKAALIVGSSQVALSTVVTSFFMGMAFGSLFVGRHLRSRRWSPLVIYGVFEIGIGSFALAFPALFEAVESVYSLLFPFIADSGPALFLMRFGILFLFFLVPTFFMGGTLPLLLDALVSRERSIGSLTSLLYGLNIAGAVAGVLVTAYWAVPYLGMNGTSVAAGFCNLAIGAIAFVAFRNTPPIHPAPVDVGPAAAIDADLDARPAGIFVGLSFLSGFAALGYQIGWARYFGLFTHSSVYFTAILLAVYLAALSAGSLVLALVLRRGAPPLRVLALSQPVAPILVFGLASAWLFAYYDYQPTRDPETWAVLPRWSIASESIDAIFLAPTLQVALVLFLPVMLLGMGLPALLAAATRSSAALRSISGSLVFWNTVGSSAGSFAVGYLLIPSVGLEHTFVCLAAVSIGGACELLFLRESEGRVEPRRLLRSPGLVVGVAALVFVGLSTRRDLVRDTLMQYGPGRPAESTRLIDLVEGPLTTAFVLARMNERVIGSGSVQLAVARRGLSDQALQGSIGPLFYPRPGTPADVLGIAFGSGQTFASILLYPFEHMDVVDISTEIVGLSLEHFADVQKGIGQDPRVDFHLDDGRHFVSRADDASYDLVTSEPPPPTDDGVYTLYSLEFYEEVHRILRDGGVLQSWLPLYRVTPDDVRGMLKTQAAVFPHTFVIKTGPIDFSIVSFKTDAPPIWRRAWLEERIDHFAKEQGVAGFHWPGPSTTYPLDSLEGVSALVLSGPADIDAIPSGVIHRDDDQRLAYSSGDRELLRRYQDLGWVARLAFTAVPITPFERLQRYFDWPLPAATLDEDRAAALAERFAVASPGDLERTVEHWERSRSSNERARLALRIASMHDGSLDKDQAYLWVGRAIDDGAHGADATRVAREIARHGLHALADDLRAWLATLEPAERHSPLASAMAAELEEYDAWTARRRAAYWLE